MGIIGNLSAGKKALRQAEEHPVRPGCEQLMAYGTIINQDSAQISLYSTGHTPDEVRAVLAEQWDIADTAGAEQTLTWLRDSGHRTEYNPYITGALWRGSAEDNAKPYLSKMFSAYKTAFSAKARDAVLDNLPDNVKAYNALPNVSDIRACLNAIRTTLGGVYNKEFSVEIFDGLDGVDSWDFERIGNVARLAFEAGYFDEDKAYEWLGVADALTRGRYTSWAQYAAAWLVGRAFWNPVLRLYSNDNMGSWTHIVGHALSLKPNRGNQVWKRFPLG